MNLTTNTEIKTIKGWEKYADEHSGENTDWGAYCKPGDLVDEEVFDYFLEILPPRTFSRVMLQVGETYGTAMNPATGKYQSTYATFTAYGKIEGYGMVYQYRGNCLAGEIQDMDVYKNYASVCEYLKATTPRGETLTRERIICKDGFSFSVQAGELFYSTPRENRTDGEYTACEVGMPKTKEDLLMPYIECPGEKPTKSVYPYTPVEVIERVIAKHGGYFIAGLPVV